MKIKVIKKSEILTPDFNGNKKLPESERTNITIKHFPTTVEVNSYKNFKSDSESNVTIKYNDSLMLLQCVGAIRNLEVGSRKIKTGEDLINSSALILGGLIAEIRNYLLDEESELNAGEEKA